MRRYTLQSRKILAVKVYVAMTHKGFVAVSADGSSAWHALVPARQTALASLILSLVNVHNSPPQPGCAYAVEKNPRWCEERTGLTRRRQAKEKRRLGGAQHCAKGRPGHQPSKIAWTAKSSRLERNSRLYMDGGALK